MIENYTTIWETFELPSKGMIYEGVVNPSVRLRSMTTAEEMKRLSPTDTPYKVMCDIIEDCMQEKPSIHVTDMAICDYQFLLHKLRIVTYGPDYKMNIRCPQCGSVSEVVANLDDLKVNLWNADVMNSLIITLPITNYQVELKFQTPHDLDIISYKSKEMKKKTKLNVDYSVLYTVASLMKKVDGRFMDSLSIEEFAKNLPIRDANYILLKAGELNKKVGVDAEIPVKCAQCGCEVVVPFRITSEFFGPSND